MRETRKEINAFLKSQKTTTEKEASAWFTVPKMDECKIIVVLNKELHTSIAHSPSVCLEVMYGPTELSKSKIVREINDNFEHRQNAGDHSFISWN